MTIEKNKTVRSYIGKAFVIALLVVFIVRVFFVESFTISSSQMETALIKGDKVFVDKTSYGVRLPTTVLSLPFVFDSIFGMKSYSDIFTLSYSRVGEGNIKRSDIVLFNNPIEMQKPLDKRALLVSRCVALAGDTVTMKNRNLKVNGVDYIFSPDLMQEYLIENEGDSPEVDEMALKRIFAHYGIPQRNYRRVANHVLLQMSRYEAFILNQSASDSISAVVNMSDFIEDYQIVVPYVDMTIDLDSISLPIYAQNIVAEIGANAELKNNTLWIAGKLQTTYTFKEDYLWMLSDNTNNSIDSRSIGFIPFSHIIGRVGFIWYGSSDRTRDYNRFLNRR